MEESKEIPVVKEYVNHYKEMGLDSSQVVLKKIAGSLGFSLTKKGRGKVGHRGSAKATSAGSAGKTGTIARRKTLAAGKGNGLDFASQHAAK